MQLVLFNSIYHITFLILSGIHCVQHKNKALFMFIYTSFTENQTIFIYLCQKVNDNMKPILQMLSLLNPLLCAICQIKLFFCDV